MRLLSKKYFLATAKQVGKQLAIWQLPGNLAIPKIPSTYSYVRKYQSWQSPGNLAIAWQFGNRQAIWQSLGNLEIFM